MGNKLLLIGGGGHCKSVLDTLLERNEFSEISIIDKKTNIGKCIMGIPILGSDDDIPFLKKSGYSHAFVSLGSIGNPTVRIRIFNYITEIGYIIPNIIDLSSKVSSYAKLKSGIFIGKNAIVNADSLISDGCIINSGSIVEHDCNIGEFVHIAPGSVLGGGAQIGEHSHVGSNSTIRNCIRVGKNSIIGMGSVVTSNIGDKVIAYGNPCREVSKNG